MAIDYGVLSTLLPQTGEDTSSTQQSIEQPTVQSLPQENLPQVTLPQENLGQGQSGDLGASTGKEQMSRPSHYTGNVTIGDQSFQFGSGGGNFPSLPYGRFYLTNTIGPVGQRIGAVAGISDKSNEGNTVNDPLSGREREGVEIHPDVSGGRLLSNGCLAINSDQFPAFNKALKQLQSQGNDLVLQVNPDGSASISALGSQEKAAQQSVQQPLTVPPIVYPWEAMNPRGVTIGDVFQQQQQRETGNITFANSTPVKNVPATTTIGSEFGEVDNPARGGYTEPGWNLGKWGDRLDGTDNKGVALPASILTQYGDTSDKNFASNFNNNYDVQVLNPQTGQSDTAPLKDIGPGAGTGAGLDMLYGTRAALGFNENFKGPVQYSIVPKGTGGQVQQQQIGEPGAITYPWQNLSQDQVTQAVQQSLQRNAFASTQTGIPAGYVPPGQQPQQKVGLVVPTESSTNPEFFGMKVATQDGAKAYDQFVKDGGDPNTIDPYTRLSVILAKNPKALLDPNNAKLLDEMVLQPQAAARDQQSIGEKVWNALGAGFGGLVDAGKAAAAYVRQEAQDTIPAIRALAEKATGQQPDPEALAALTDISATNIQGSAKTVSDVYNQLSMLRLAAINLHVPLANMFTNDPQKRQEIHDQYVKNVQQLAADQQKVADITTGWQGQMAQSYANTGLFSDVGEKMKTWQTNPQAVEGFSQIAQLVGPEALTAVAGMKVAGAFRPMLATRLEEAATNTMQARAEKFMMDSTQSVPRDAAAEASNLNYLNARAAQANLAPDARAADAKFQQESQNLQNQLTSVGKIASDPQTATGFAQGVANVTGNAIAAGGDVAAKVLGTPDRILNAISLGSPTVRSVADKLFRGLLYGGAALAGHGWAGRLLEFGVDALEDADAIPKAASGLRDFFKTYGRELGYGESSVPFWTRMSQGTRLIPPRMAAFLDTPAVQTITAGLKGIPAGMATGAFIGALGDPNDPLSGAISNAIPGGLYAMAGGGFGQWQRFNHPGEVYLQARGDWKRTLDTFSDQQRQQFLSLQPKDQLMLSTYLQQSPGVRLNFVHDPAGPAGSFDPHIHTFDTADKPTITVNLANSEGTVRGIFAHELMHATQSAGMTPDIYDALLGNVDRATPGQYTALDAKGNPMQVDPATGRYTTNQEFQNFRNDYVTSLARNGQPTAHLSDLDIARELFAEHGVDHLLSSQAAVNATSAFRPSWINHNMLKNAYAKIGFAFDRQGNVVQGTHLFENVRPNDAIDKLTNKLFQTRFRDRSINSEELPTRKFTKEDLRSTNAADTFLDTAPEIMRNPDGSVMRDARGVPLMRTPAQVRQYNAKLTNDIADRISALPDDRKLDIGYRTLPNGNIFVRYLPQELRDALAKTNEYNPHQIKSLNALSEMMADKSKMGTNFRLFYNKALSEGKRYGSFSGTEKFAVPYGFEISKKSGQVNLSSVDFDQLNQNYLNNATRAPFRQIWGNPSEFVQDANTYFQNHADGNPGATGIGEQKRDAINSLLRLDTSVNRDANPLLQGREGFPGTRPIIKSYRIDRASQVTPLEKTSPFNDIDQYYRMNRNFRPGASEVSGSAPGLPVAESAAMRPLNYLAAIKMPNGMVYMGATHDSAYYKAGEPHYSTPGVEYGFAHRKTGEFITHDEADEILNEAIKHGYKGPGIVGGSGEVSYLPGASEAVSYRPAEKAPGAPPDETAIPVTTRTTRTGKEVPQEIPYDITKAPLVADKQPPDTLSGKNDFGHVDFLTKPDQQRLTHLNDASAVTDYADKLVAEHDRFKDNQQVMAAKNWYDDVLQHLKKGFGGDKELFAQLLAATSAQNGVRTNFADALEAYKQYRSGAYDDAIREFKRTGKITEEMKPLKSNGAKFGVNSDAVLKVLADKWMENVKGPKTPNFFRNLFKRGTDATIDMWAARTMRRLGNEGVEGADPQWRIQPASETGVSNLDFAFSQQAFKQAADRLGMKAHQLQAILWYGEKHHWATQGWSKGGVSAAMESYIPQLKAYAAAPEVVPPKADTRRMGVP